MLHFRGSTDMTTGNLLSDGLLDQVLAVVKHFLKTHKNTLEHQDPTSPRPTTRFRTHAVILDEALDAASSFLGAGTGSSDPAEPNATVCEIDLSTNTYKQTEQRLSVVNHSTTDHPVDTPGAAIPINGHYWFFGDCDPVADRPDPPWNEV